MTKKIPAEPLKIVLMKFGEEYEWPYRHMDKSRTPASQQTEARMALLAETLEAIADELLGKDAPKDCNTSLGTSVAAQQIRGCVKQVNDAWRQHIRNKVSPKN